MTPDQAEEILKDVFPDADQDDIQTYVWGPDDPDDYFSKIADPEELKADFREILKG